MTQKLYSLTPEHRAQLKPWADKWIANAMSTKAMDDDDRAACRAAVIGMYAAANLPPPRHIVFVPSPFVLLFAGGFSAAIWHLSKGNAATFAATEAASLAATEAASLDATFAATRVATWDATDPATFAATFAATRVATLAATRDATEDATSDATFAATRDATFAATFAATSAATEDATEAATSAATWDATEAATFAATFAATSAATWDATEAATEAATFAATFAATSAATRDATRDATWAATWAATFAATFAATSAATEDATEAATRDATWDATEAATSAATRDATRDATWAATWAASLAATEAASLDATFAATRVATWDATEAATWTASLDATSDATWTATRDATEAERLKSWYVFYGDMKKLARLLGVGNFGLQCASSAHRMYDGGNQWSYRDSYVSFFQDVAQLPLDYSAYNHWRILAERSGPRIVHPDFCMISDRPEVLTVDDQNRPHNDTGPFCRWRDGSALYSWHGARVPARWIEDRANLAPAEVLAHDNVEIRAAGAAIVGWPKMLSALDAKVIDDSGSDDVGQLIELTLPGLDKPGRFLKAVCPRNPPFICEGVPYVSDVDGKPIDTALAAQAWRVGLTQSEYRHPEVRT